MLFTLNDGEEWRHLGAGCATAITGSAVSSATSCGSGGTSHRWRASTTAFGVAPITGGLSVSRLTSPAVFMRAERVGRYVRHHSCTHTQRVAFTGDLVLIPTHRRAGTPTRYSSRQTSIATVTTSLAERNAMCWRRICVPSLTDIQTRPRSSRRVNRPE